MSFLLRNLCPTGQIVIAKKEKFKFYSYFCCDSDPFICVHRDTDKTDYANRELDEKGKIKLYIDVHWMYSRMFFSQ